MGRAELTELMESLIIEVKQEDKRCIFSDTAKNIIAHIAEYAKGTDLYKTQHGTVERFWSENDDKNASDVYMHMINKIGNAPTILHALGAAILVMPRLDILVNGERIDSK